MKFLDKVALNRLIKILTDFVLGIMKIFKPKDNEPVPPLSKPKRKRPILDLLDKWI